MKNLYFKSVDWRITLKPVITNFWTAFRPMKVSHMSRLKNCSDFVLELSGGARSIQVYFSNTHGSAVVGVKFLYIYGTGKQKSLSNISYIQITLHSIVLYNVCRMYNNLLKYVHLEHAEISWESCRSGAKNSNCWIF